MVDRRKFLKGIFAIGGATATSTLESTPVIPKSYFDQKPLTPFDKVKKMDQEGYIDTPDEFIRILKEKMDTAAASVLEHHGYTVNEYRNLVKNISNLNSTAYGYTNSARKFLNEHPEAPDKNWRIAKMAKDLMCSQKVLSTARDDKALRDLVNDINKLENSTLKQATQYLQATEQRTSNSDHPTFKIAPDFKIDEDFQPPSLKIQSNYKVEINWDHLDSALDHIDRELPNLLISIEELFQQSPKSDELNMALLENFEGEHGSPAAFGKLLPTRKLMEMSAIAEIEKAFGYNSSFKITNIDMSKPGLDAVSIGRINDKTEAQSLQQIGNLSRAQINSEIAKHLLNNPIDQENIRLYTRTNEVIEDNPWAIKGKQTDENGAWAKSVISKLNNVSQALLDKTNDITNILSIIENASTLLASPEAITQEEPNTLAIILNQSIETLQDVQPTEEATHELKGPTYT